MREQWMPPRLIWKLWPTIDRLLRVIYRIRPLKADGSGIISFQLRRYKGPTRILSDGSEVRDGDTIMELHLNSAWFSSRRKLNLTASQSPSEFLGCFAQDLRLIARRAASGMLGNVAVLHSNTLLYVAARRLGFQVDELPDSLWTKGARFYMAGLMQVYHLRGDGAPGLRGKTWELKEVWLSRAALFARYGPEHL